MTRQISYSNYNRVWFVKGIGGSPCRRPEREAILATLRARLLLGTMLAVISLNGERVRNGRPGKPRPFASLAEARRFAYKRRAK